MSKVHAVVVNLHQHQGYPLHANTQSRPSSVSGLKAVTPPSAAQQSHGPLHSIQNISSIVEQTIISSKFFLKILF